MTKINQGRTKISRSQDPILHRQVYHVQNTDHETKRPRAKLKKNPLIKRKGQVNASSIQTVLWSDLC